MRFFFIFPLCLLAGGCVVSGFRSGDVVMPASAGIAADSAETGSNGRTRDNLEKLVDAVNAVSVTPWSRPASLLVLLRTHDPEKRRQMTFSGAVDAYAVSLENGQAPVRQFMADTRTGLVHARALGDALPPSGLSGRFCIDNLKTIEKGISVLRGNLRVMTAVADLLADRATAAELKDIGSITREYRLVLDRLADVANGLALQVENERMSFYSPEIIPG